MVFEIDAASRHSITGWIAQAQPAEPVSLDIRINGVDAGTVMADGRRMDASGLPDTSLPACGFRVSEAEFPGLAVAEEVEIRCAGLRIYRSLRVARTCRERLFFMHIPKTGGTSMNAMLAATFENAFDHLEGQPPDALRSILALRHPSSIFFSGHLLFSSVAASLESVPTRLATLVREPIDHLVSHIAWLYRIGRDPALLAVHHPLIQAAALRIVALDPTSEASVASWLESFTPTDRELFFNTQTRYLGSSNPGEPVTTDFLQVARDTMRRFDVVGRLEAPELFVRRMERVLGADLGPIPHIRANPDVERFRVLARHRDRLAEFIALDEVIYADAVAAEGLGRRLIHGWRRAASR
jgi:hypothetical protein